MKPTILAPLTLFIGIAFHLSGCGASGTTDTAAAPTPISELDAMINEYENASSDCLRMAKKHTTGDVSVTVLLIVARKTFQDDGVKLQQSAAKMSPEQSQRVAAIKAKTAPCLGP
ncbi:MAG: hypothetical protein ABIU29_03455 [Chthoniobacterales bacterium]